MRKHMLATVVLGLVASLALTAIAMANERSMTEGPALTLHKTQYGSVLFNGASRALYVFGRDTGHSSTCSRACAKAWPPYIVASKPRAGAGVSAGLVGTTRRSDGKLQATYGGHPLYFYSGDPKGQAKCQGVNNFGGTWRVVAASGKPVK